MKSSIFRGVKAAVLVVSDSCATRARRDESGEALVRLLKEKGARVARKQIVPDEKTRIRRALRSFCDTLRADLVLTTGGTGLSPRDVTPEATRSVIAKEVPGLAELMRLKSFKKTERAALSRGICGLRGLTLVINLPGSPAGACDSFEAIAHLVPHALAMARGEGHPQ